MVATGLVVYFMGYVGAQHLQKPVPIQVIEADPAKILNPQVYAKKAEATPETKEWQDVIPESEKISLNSAKTEDLQRIPGIGEAMAERIMDYRAQHGKFTQLEQLRNITGIGRKTFEKIVPYIKL